MFNFIIRSGEAASPVTFKLNGTALQARKAAYDLSKKIGTVNLITSGKVIAYYCYGRCIDLQ